MTRIMGAFGLAGLSLFMLVGFFASGSPLSAVAVTALALTVGLPAVGSALLFRSQQRERTRLSGRRALLRQQTLQAEILRLAAGEGGRLTVLEVSSGLGVSPEEATEALKSLVMQQHADLQVTDGGLLVYTFDDVRLAGEKHSGRGVLDA